jgi:hypothetical protein
LRGVARGEFALLLESFRRERATEWHAVSLELVELPLHIFRRIFIERRRIANLIRRR